MTHIIFLIPKNTGLGPTTIYTKGGIIYYVIYIPKSEVTFAWQIKEKR